MESHHGISPRHRPAILAIGLIVLFAVFSLQTRPALADGGQGHAEEKAEKKMEMDHHHSSSKEEMTLPPGTKELKIKLSGPFCHKHPDEIRAALMQLAGVLHVEAFSGRKYILVHYDGSTALSAEEMTSAVSGLAGSGWRCKGTASNKRRTER